MNIKDLIQLYVTKKDDLHHQMISFLQSNGYTITSRLDENAKYIFAVPETPSPIILTAHLDTINDEKWNCGCIKEDEIYVKDDSIIGVKPGINKVLGGDDRNGIYLIKDLIENGFRPYILLPHYEEVGGEKGVIEFIVDFENTFPKEIKVGVSLDYDEDCCVTFYDNESSELERIFNFKGFKKCRGIYTDIASLGNYFKFSYANMSVAYYDNHTKDETTNFNVLTRISWDLHCIMNEILNSAKNNNFVYKFFDRGFNKRGERYIERVQRQVKKAKIDRKNK